MRSLKKFGIVFFACLGLAGCYYDKEAILYPGSSCQPVANSAFTTNVLPILNAKCNSCHSGTAPSAGILLDSHTEVTKYVNNGSLMGSINHAGFSPMPKNQSKLPACEITIIQDWINAGVLNN